MNTYDIIDCLQQIKDSYTWNAQADLALIFAIKCVERFGEEMEAEIDE